MKSARPGGQPGACGRNRGARVAEQAGMKVLVAINEKTLRTTLVGMLRDIGNFETTVAAHGSEAWDKARQQAFDLVVANWSMPEMSGPALLKVLRADSNLAALPVMLVASEITKGQVIEAGEAGVTDIILLPLSLQVLKRKIESLTQAEQDPQALEAERHYQLGLQLMESESWEEALLCFQKVISTQQNPEVYYNMGFIKTAQGRYEEAIQYFRRATQINNTFAKAFERMGECYIKLGRPRLAEKSFQRAADIYLEKHMDDNAELVLREVLKLNPNTLNVFNSLGIIYRRQGRYALALEQYKKALRVSPRDENILYNIGRIYFDLGEYGMARDILQKAVELNPGFDEAVQMLRIITMGPADNGSGPGPGAPGGA
jgi:tetratricopeptide (TPR) repeat protein